MSNNPLPSETLARSAFLVMATAIDKQPIPLRVFQERSQAEHLAAALIEYHLSAPHGLSDEETWEEFDAKLKRWREMHPGGVEVSRHQKFGIYEVPFGLQETDL